MFFNRWCCAKQFVCQRKYIGMTLFLIIFIDVLTFIVIKLSGCSVTVGYHFFVVEFVIVTDTAYHQTNFE